VPVKYQVSSLCSLSFMIYSINLLILIQPYNVLCSRGSKNNSLSEFINEYIIGSVEILSKLEP
jgi:hypothetical protein